MKSAPVKDLPLGPLALILSKHYYGVLSKRLEKLDIDRYYSILFFLSTHNGCSQQHICNSLAIDKTAMVKVMDYLIKAGYIAREVNPADRREHFITLTPKGRRQTATVVSAFSAIDQAVFAGLSRTAKDHFYRIVARLLHNLKELPANDLFFNYKKTKPAKTRASVAASPTKK